MCADSPRHSQCLPTNEHSHSARWQALTNSTDAFTFITQYKQIDKSTANTYRCEMPTPNTTVDQLKRAIVVAEQIEKLKAELAAILGGASTAPVKADKVKAASVKVRKKRKLSPEARARIVAAVKARWARAKGTKGAKSTGKPAAKAAKAPKATKRKRNLTPEGRARLAASMKARWAARKATQGPASKA